MKRAATNTTGYLVGMHTYRGTTCCRLTRGHSPRPRNQASAHNFSALLTIPPKAMRFPKSVTSHAISISPSLLEYVPSAPPGNPFAAAALSRWSRGFGRSVDHGTFTVIFADTHRAHRSRLTHKHVRRHDDQQAQRRGSWAGLGGERGGAAGPLGRLTRPGYREERRAGLETRKNDSLARTCSLCVRASER